MVSPSSVSPETRGRPGPCLKTECKAPHDISCPKYPDKEAPCELQIVGSCSKVHQAVGEESSAVPGLEAVNCVCVWHLANNPRFMCRVACLRRVAAFITHCQESDFRKGWHSSSARRSAGPRLSTDWWQTLKLQVECFIVIRSGS